MGNRIKQKLKEKKNENQFNPNWKKIDFVLKKNNWM